MNDSCQRINNWLSAAESLQLSLFT